MPGDAPLKKKIPRRHDCKTRDSAPTLAAHRHVTVVAALRSAFASLHGGVSGLLDLLSSALPAPGEAAPDDRVQTFGAVNSSVKPRFVSCLV